jgi:hypothetical protein
MKLFTIVISAIKNKIKKLKIEMLMDSNKDILVEFCIKYKSKCFN